MSYKKNYVCYPDCMNVLELVDRMIEEGGENSYSVFDSNNIESILREYPSYHIHIMDLIPNNREYDGLKEVVSTYLEHCLCWFNDMAQMVEEGTEDPQSLQETFNAIIGILSKVAIKFDDYGLNFYDFSPEDYMDIADDYEF